MKIYIKRPMFFFFTLILLLTGLLSKPVLAGAESDDSPVFSKAIEEAVYQDLLDAVKDVIKGKGINIAHTLPPSDMLGRTGPAFGIDKPILKNGEIIEFCSAKISHQLIMANPKNIILCPFTISVYELSSEPGTVYLTYRKPHVIDAGSREAVDNMVKLLDEIIEEASEW